MTPGPSRPRVFGKRFTALRIDQIRQILDARAGISRAKLATRVAEALKRCNPDGRPKFRACLGVLECLEEPGIPTLPVNRVKKRASGLDAVDLRLAIRKTPVTAALADLQQITLQRVNAPEEGKVWNASVDHHTPPGLQAPLRLPDEVPHPARSAADHGLSAVRGDHPQSALPGRVDRLEQRAEEPDAAFGGCQFPLCDLRRREGADLASKALGLAARQPPDDWQDKYHYRPVLIETFPVFP
ncbi:MAG: hypothetical protein OXC72_15555 [Roseovarius sp.]|nr:hypothetical protein [Roseovarius sp.]